MWTGAVFALALAAGDPAPSPDPTGLVETSTAADPLEYGLPLSVLDGAWSIVLTASWAVAARNWDAPYPYGVTALAAVRTLYGTTGSVMLAGEVALARLLSGPDFEGISGAFYRIDWLGGWAVPACPRAPSAGCGLGLGGFSELRATISRSVLPLEFGVFGGWMMGRVDDDSRRTLAESSWVLSPARILARFEGRLGPISGLLELGPGAFFGMHDLHEHPKPDSMLPRSLTEITVQDIGVGAGGILEASLAFWRRFALEGQIEVAPLILGSASSGGVPLWRTVSLGLGLWPPIFEPLKMSLRLWAAELSDRSIGTLGHRAAMLRFELPVPLPDDLDPVD
jgi:hypothetical protein